MRYRSHDKRIFVFNRFARKLVSGQVFHVAELFGYAAKIGYMCVSEDFHICVASFVTSPPTPLHNTSLWLRWRGESGVAEYFSNDEILARPSLEERGWGRGRKLN